jgi:hypothetical protein
VDTIRIMGLTRLDGLDLKKQFPDAQISFEPGSGADAKHGELATWAVVMLTLAGIKALASWLMKNRSKGKIAHSITVTNSKGETRTDHFEMEYNESTSDADVVKALTKFMKADPGLIPEK